MKFLVTAGPTREPIDPVRFISNPSSGKMGFAVAREALKAEHQVVLITGPVSLSPPDGAEVVRVVTAHDMEKATRRSAADADCIVMTAAVTDYRPARPRSRKIKKGRSELLLKLVRNPDILEQLARRKGKKVLIGFALETDNAERNARRKLHQKNLDAVVLNAPDAFNADRSSVTIYTSDGRTIRLDGASKYKIARELVKLAERFHDKIHGKDSSS